MSEEGLFTTAAIEHRPQSVTARNSFHGTSISIFQHPDTETEMLLLDLQETNQASFIELKLPKNYASLPPTKSFAAEFALQSVNPSRVVSKQAMNELLEWISNLLSINKVNSCIDVKILLQWYTSYDGYYQEHFAAIEF